MSSTRGQVLSLYRQLLRTGRKFNTYNFKEYSQRRIREEFKDNTQLQEQEQINKLIDLGKVELESLHRQVIVNNLYSNTKLVVENIK